MTLQRYKPYGGMPGMPLSRGGRGFISSRPGTLKEGFVEEASPELRLRAK